MDGPITSNPTAPRVWEAYIDATGVFKPNGAPPDPWGGTNTFLASLVPDHKRGQKVLFASSKNALSEIYQASFGTQTFPWIADLNSNYVFYEIHLNKPEYDYIVSNTLYSQDGQTAFLVNRMRRSASRRDRTQTNSYGAIEVKAAWKQIGAGDDPTKFYTVVATLIDPATGQPDPGRDHGPRRAAHHHPDRQRPAVGVVDLRTRRQCPGRSSLDRETSPKPRTPHGRRGREPLQLQRPYPDPAGERLRLQAVPWPLPQHTPPANPQPTQITRVLNNTCINGAWTQCLNSTMQAELAGTVWANYRLVTTQWPLPISTPQGTVKFLPANVTNTTMETYVQNRSGSCMGCHNSCRDGRHAPRRRRPTSATCSSGRSPPPAPPRSCSAAGGNKRGVARVGCLQPVRRWRAGGTRGEDKP